MLRVKANLLVFINDVELAYEASMTAKTRTRSQRLIFSEFERSQLGQVLLEHSDVLARVALSRS